jgi:hypothetical protein
MAVCECTVLVAQTLSYPNRSLHNWPLTAILLHFHRNRTLVCIAARAFSALCAFQAVQIGFFSVKIDVGSDRDFKTFCSRTFSALVVTPDSESVEGIANSSFVQAAAVVIGTDNVSMKFKVTAINTHIAHTHKPLGGL